MWAHVLKQEKLNYKTIHVTIKSNVYDIVQTFIFMYQLSHIYSSNRKKLNYSVITFIINSI